MARRESSRALSSGAKFKFTGSIVRIKLLNFMTYDKLDVYLGPNLNMVLGPNGTGKSAVVCSIIIGLAGDVALTGRGTSPTDFVKKNTSSCTTYIELFNKDGSNFSVERTITITNHTAFKIDHKSDWVLNGQSAKKTDVQEFIKKLNIKVDNLCQFLPQDSVSSFVKMNSSELLENTLKAVGDVSLVDDQRKLIAYTASINEIEKNLNSLKKDCEANEVNAERLEGEVQKLKERSVLVKQKKICEQKLIYTKYKTFEGAKEQKGNKLLDLRKKLREHEEQSEPFKKSIEVYETRVTSLRNSRKSYEKDCGDFKDLARRTYTSLEGIQVSCQSEFAEFKGKEEDERNRQSRLNLLTSEIENIECHLAEVRNTDCTRQLKAIEDDMNKKKDELRNQKKLQEKLENSIQQDNNTMDRYKKEADEINAVRDKRFELLRNQFPSVYRVHEWLLKNRDKFKKKIYMPMMCELSVKDLKYVRVVENAISRNDLTAFVCEDQDDLKLFTRLVRDEFHCKINVILSKPEEFEEQIMTQNQSRLSLSSQDQAKTLRSQNVSASRHSSANELREYGVIGYLSDLIEGPKPIINYLCKANNFHRIPYAESCNEKQLKYLLENFGIIYVGAEFYQTSRSKYDNSKLTTTDRIREANLLRHWFDKQRHEMMIEKYNSVKNQRDQLMVEHKAICDKSEKLSAEWENLHVELKALRLKQNEKETLQRRLKMKQEALDKVRNEQIDLDAERKKLQKNIEKINLRSVDLLKQLCKVYSDYQKARESQMEATIVVRVAEINLRIAKRRFAVSIKNTSRLSEEIRREESDYKKMEVSLNDLRRVTAEKVPGFTPRGKLNAQTQNDFSEIEADTEEDLEAKQAELEFRINGIYREHDPAVLEQYRNQRNELQEKRGKISKLEAQLKTQSTDRNNIKERWLPALEEVIKVINQGYEEFMRKLSYGGKVQLDYDESNKDDFSQYGVKIMVKYRDDEQLIPLSSTRQSGGERSVATMIYMLALQTKTSVPFRCVDEINQGMDKENERKVFELLVATADSSSSQYFLVSPKLLPDLPYSSKMRIHIVFNGNHLSESLFTS